MRSEEVKRGVRVGHENQREQLIEMGGGHM